MAISLTDLLKQLILGAIGDPDSANELIDAVENGGGGGIGWSTPVDSNITLDSDNTYAIGSASEALSEIWTPVLKSNGPLYIASAAGESINIDASSDAVSISAGVLRLLDGSEGTAGDVWTSTDGSGSGTWAPVPGGGGVLPNDTYYQIDDSTNTPTDIFKVNTSDELIFKKGPVPFDVGEIDLGSPALPWNNVWSNQLTIVEGNSPFNRILFYADSVTTNYNVALPPTIGTAGDVLTIDSISGGDTAILSWAAAGAPTGAPNRLSFFDPDGNLSNSEIVYGVPTSWPNIVGGGQAIGLIGENAGISTSGGNGSFLAFGFLDRPYADGTKIVFNSGYLPSPLAFDTTYFLYEVTISTPFLSPTLARYNVCAIADPASRISWPVGPPGFGANAGTTFATVSDDISFATGKLFINGDSLDTASNGDVWTLQDQTTGEGSWAAPNAGFEILAFTSDPGPSGVAGSPIFDVAFVVTGLLATDTILSVTQKTPGASGTLALLGWHSQANDAITGEYVADPGVGSVVVVAVKRS